MKSMRGHFSLRHSGSPHRPSRRRFGVTLTIPQCGTRTSEFSAAEPKQLLLGLTLPNGLPMECQKPSSTSARVKALLLAVELGSDRTLSVTDCGAAPLLF